MRKIMLAFVAMFFGVLSYAQVEGRWKTIDDETGQAKSIVEIFKKSDGKYYGKISQLLVKPANNNCVNCKDDRKNKPLIGMEIIRGVHKDGNSFTGGTIVDPSNGKVYKVNLTPKGDQLDVRGYIGFSALGRTQTWYKVK
ncbi:MAG: DUF2147 domain-containing protein [Chryseobacterium sp.]|nr:MAG: DUF2147 domain-containing protein [Chryseobacterium sp.]